VEIGAGQSPWTYSWVRELGVESLVTESSGDEWFHRLAECVLAKGGQVTRRLKDATTGPFIEVNGTLHNGESTDTRLLVWPIDGGLALFAGGRDEPPDEEACSLWLDAARCATTRLGLEGEPQHWSALIGPPQPRVGGSEATLGETVAIGPFVLEPQHRPFRESWPSRPPSLLGRALNLSWFIGVEGQHAGYNWPIAGRRAAFDIHRLCTLLSVAGVGPTVLREAPAPLEWGRRTVPETNPWEPMPGQLGDHPTPAIWTPPSWLDDAWNRVQSMPWLAHALSAHHEGLRAQYEHPSLALVAFIGAIEAVSNRMWIVHRCEACGGHIGIAARFRATLRVVLPPDDADFLGRAYKPRSKTVHEGHLHGGEATAGVYSIGLFSPDSALTFEWGVVYRMGRASEALLMRAVSGGLPTKAIELVEA
jgi:hypothetical protein